MKGKILLNYDENVKKVEQEEQDRFLRDLLGQMGVPVDEFWASGEPLNIKQRMRLRSMLPEFHVKIYDDLDGHIQVYVDNTLVGEWFKSTYRLKRDLRELDPRKQVYVEMEVNFWTIFEEQQ